MQSNNRSVHTDSSSQRDPRSQSTRQSTHRTGCMHIYETNFFAACKTLLFLPQVVSRALGCEARTRPAYKPRSKYGSRPGSVARAVGAQNLASNHGIAFRGARADQAHGNPPNVIFLLALCCCVPVPATSTTPVFKCTL